MYARQNRAQVSIPVMFSSPALRSWPMGRSATFWFSRRGRRASPAPPLTHPRLRGMLALLCWLYLLAVIAVWLVLRFQSDRWWLATLVLFGPRWLVAAPLPLLLPLAHYAR